MAVTKHVVVPQGFYSWKYDDVSVDTVLVKKVFIHDIFLTVEIDYVSDSYLFILRWQEDGVQMSGRHYLSINKALDAMYKDEKEIYLYEIAECLKDAGRSAGLAKTFHSHIFDDSFNTSLVEAKARKLPGMDYITVCPSTCPPDVKRNLYGMVQHLNDSHKWTRDKIADWLERLAERDGLDLSFSNKE